MGSTQRRQLQGRVRVGSYERSWPMHGGLQNGSEEVQSNGPSHRHTKALRRGCSPASASGVSTCMAVHPVYLFLHVGNMQGGPV